MVKSIDFSKGVRGKHAGMNITIVGATKDDSGLARSVALCENASMNREEAAAALGISVRSLQRAVQSGLVGVSYKRGASGKEEARFDADEIARYKQTREAETVKPAVALAVAPMDDSMLARSVALVARETTVEILRRVKGVRPGVPIDSKLLLKINEATHMTGLSRDVLREAINSGKLKAKLIGRAWRIKRDDLESYIKKL